ncbi:MAG: helical backbone metal receptor, partial [Campylobacterota bacterium]|nr:helical backbone metal receptor [Campylobacterota bacterium]
FCTYPKDAQNKTKVGGYFSPSLEKIISLKPDIVIMQNSSVKLSKKLDKLGIKTKVLKLTTLNDIKTTIKDIGIILKKENRSQEILDRLNQKLKNIKNILNNKKILIVIGHNLKLEKRIFVVGQNLYLNDIINQSGNQNAFLSKRAGQPILNMENIIATNPDIVILLAPFTKKKNLTKKELIEPWLKLPINATKTKSIYVLDKEYAGISSHRLINFLEDFKGYLQDVKTKQLQ